MNSFANFHPLVNFFYFFVVIGFAMFFMNPVSLGISLFCAALYSLMLYGKKAVRVGILYMLPLMIFTGLMNPLFNHRGETILTYLPNGNPLTLESILYGIGSAIMLCAVIAWFSCFNKIFTSDKIIYLFGRVFPALSLILSMIFQLVPRFKTQIKIISNAQKGIGNDADNGNIFQKAKQGIEILSIMVTWILENSIETADSMKGRGYGLPGRTAFSIFVFTSRDGFAVAYILFCAVAVLAVNGFAAYATHFFLAFFPIAITLLEELKWKRLESKI
jgi:energy-coupling factor transport system permease protein